MAVSISHIGFYLNLQLVLGIPVIGTSVLTPKPITYKLRSFKF